MINKFISKVYSPHIIFVLVLLVLTALYYPFNHFNSPPENYHYWRQSDSGSQVVNYMKNKYNFFHFGTLSLSGDDNTTNNVVSEFPVLYYFSALINSFFGFNYFTLRFINLIIMLYGLFSLTKLSYGLLNNMFFAIAITVITYNVYPLAFYINTSLPDIPALGFFFSGIYYFYVFTKTNNNKHLILSVFLLMLSSLLKITLYYGIFSVLFFLFINRFNIFNLKNKLTVNKKHIYLLIIFSILPLMWALFVMYYNRLHFNGVFMSTITPFWAIKDINGFVVKLFSYEYMKGLIAYEAGYFFIFTLLVNIVFIHKLKKEYLYFFIMFLFATIFYIALWFSQFNPHNYYFIETIPLYTASYIMFFYLIKKYILQYKYLSIIVYLTISVFAILFTNDTFNKINKTYHTDYLYEFKQQRDYFSDLYDINSYLNKIGVKDTDSLIFDFDYTPNYSLYVTQHYGWSKRNLRWFSIDKLIKKGATYLICNKRYPNKISVNHKSYKIGEWKNIEIYSLKEYKK